MWHVFSILVQHVHVVVFVITNLHQVARLAQQWLP